MIDSKLELSLEQIKLFRKATGCPVGKIRSVIEAMEPGLRERMLIAVQTQEGPTFYDPIEDDEQFRSVIKNAEQVATKHAEETVGMHRRGKCHLIWTEQARILKEVHGIVWYTPRELNPGTCYD
jgi:hypothetical protein